MSGAFFDEPRILHTGDGVVVVRYRCVLIAWWYNAATLVSLQRRASFDQQVLADEGRMACITIIDPNVAQPSPEARALMAESSRATAESTMCHAYLVLGVGAKAALVRTIVSAVRWRAHVTHPEKVFAEDVDEVVAWTTEKLQQAAVDIDPSTLSLAIGAALSARDVQPPPASTPELPEVTLTAAHTQSSFGRYGLERALGAGGMAQVYLATHKGVGGFHKRLVIKLMHPHLERDPEIVDMFLREARMAALVNSTHVVQVFDAGEVNGVHFIAMEHVDGASLHDLARRAWAAGVQIPWPIISAVCADAARGLHAAHHATDHTGAPLALVHRDISPDNILVGADGVAKVADFGLAKGLGANLTSSGVVRGKVAYMAPEQLMGQDVDARADLYALGATLYWLCTREFPFSSPDDAVRIMQVLQQPPPKVREKRPDLPPGLDALLDSLLRKDPQQRPADGMGVARTLAELGAASQEDVAGFVRAHRPPSEPSSSGPPPSGPPPGLGRPPV